MQEFTVSHRLMTLADFIPSGAKVADIGGDHAYLLIQLAREGRLKRGIVGEINQGPFQNACRNVKRMGYQSVIDVRFGDGLSVVQATEFDVLVISGMGGTLIKNILDKGKEKLAGVQKMVLQPNIGGHQVRRWLDQQGWQITDETLVEEEGVLYEILVSSPGKNIDLYQDAFISTELLYEIGPVLWKQRHPLLINKLKNEQERKEKMLRQLQWGVTDEAQKKWKQETEKLETWKKVIQCLSMDSN